MPLRPSDLVFNKTPDGIVSCGYMVKNAMLNSTLNHQFQSGGSGGGNVTGSGYDCTGGSGVVILRYTGTITASSTTGSPTRVVDGGYTYYTFTGDGSITY